MLLKRHLSFAFQYYSLLFDKFQIYILLYLNLFSNKIILKLYFVHVITCTRHICCPYNTEINFLLRNIKEVSNLASSSNYSFKYLYKKILYQYYKDQRRLQLHNWMESVVAIALSRQIWVWKYLMVLRSSERRRHCTDYIFPHTPIYIYL